MTLEVEEILVKLKNRGPSQNTKFCFLYTKVDRLVLELHDYKRTSELTVAASNFLAQDKLTINKKFVRFLSVRDMKDPSSQFFYLKLAKEKLKISETSKKTHNLISVVFRLKPFDLILNRDVMTRLNFFLTNYKVQPFYLHLL